MAQTEDSLGSRVEGPSCLPQGWAELLCLFFSEGRTSSEPWFPLAGNVAAGSTAVWWIMNTSTSKQFDPNLFWGERYHDLINIILKWLQSFGSMENGNNSLTFIKWFRPVFAHLFHSLVPAHSPGLPPPLRSYFRGLHLSLSCSFLPLTSRYFED